MRRTSLLLAASFALATTGCVKAAIDALAPNVPGGTTNTSTSTSSLSATIGSTNWSAAGTPAVSVKNNILALAGLDLNNSVSFAIAQFAGVGTYSVAYLNTPGSSAIVANAAGQGWDTYLPGGTGTITFTTSTSNHVVGTFSFDAPAASGGATGTSHVTNGKFDVTF